MLVMVLFMPVLVCDTDAHLLLCDRAGTGAHACLIVLVRSNKQCSLAANDTRSTQVAGQDLVLTGLMRKQKAGRPFSGGEGNGARRQSGYGSGGMAVRVWQ
eukprot:scaffold290137_cov17-Tisochrysis_lutea.AAC.1